MSPAEEPESPEVPRRRRPSLEAPLSVLKILADRTGEAPRVSLREEDSAGAVSPTIAPGSSERGSLPEGRGNYQVLGEIARGGMGVVLRGHDTDLGRDVAMKVLSKDLAHRAEVVQRFVEEAQIGGQLQHPGIVPVYELGLMSDDRPYFTMKLVKGRTLAVILAERASVTADRRRLLDVFLAVCRTVAYAHSRGVIHRDLKPANIMVGAFGEVQVVDWGLAKVLARGGTADEKRARAARSELTVLETVRSDGSGSGTDSMVGSVLGTPAYMPPEQATGMVDRLDERSDVFALGAILCEILTGAPPYTGEQEKTLMQAAQAELDDASERLARCEADPELVKIARQCLVAAKQARPRNAGVLAESLDAHLSTVEERARAAELAAVEARVHAQEERRARRLTLALAGALVALLVLGGGGWAWRERQQRAETARIGKGLEEIHAEVARLRDEGRPDEAVQAARRGQALIEGLDADHELRGRAQDLVATTEAAAERARLTREKTNRDATLLDRLDALRIEASVPLSAEAHEPLDLGFAQAFHDWGLDVEADLVQSLATLRASGMEAELAPALDDWASVRRWAYGWESFEAEAMNALAADLDPEPVRVRMREALMRRDLASLLAIANSGEAESLPASSVWVLANALKDLGTKDVAYRILDHAIERFPTNLRLRMSMVIVARELGRHGVAMRHVSAAVALRPEFPGLRVLEGQTLLGNYELPAALRAFERALEHDPRDPAALRSVCECEFELGHWDATVAAADRLEALETLAGAEVTRRATARYRLGTIDLETLTREMVAYGSFAVLSPAWMRLWGREADRDPDGALAMIKGVGMNEQLESLILLLASEAHLLRGDPQSALEILDRFDAADRGHFNANLRMGLLAKRARALHAVGRSDVARELLVQARRLAAAHTADSPESWKSSFFLADLQRCEEELSR